MHWVALLAGLFLVYHYYGLHDDAFLYFRYVDNLLFMKVGLVYNAGEYVEGFSSPLYVLLLAAARSLRIGYAQAVLALSGAAFVLFWAGLWQIERRLAAGQPVFGAVLLFLCVSYGVDAHFGSGLETPFVMLSAVGYALFVLSPASRALQVCVALMPLLRHELIVPVAWAVAGVYGSTRRWPWTLLTALATSLVALALFRIVYYADLLPNTFYLKDVVDVGQGLVFVHDTLASYHVYAILGLTALVLLLERRHGRDAAPLHLVQRAIIVGGALLSALYVVRIGGGYLHFRYLAFSFCLLLIGCAGIVDLPLRRRLSGAPAARWALASLAGIGVLAFSAAQSPRCLTTHPYFIEAAGRAEEKQACTDDVGLFDLAAHRAQTGRLQEGFWEIGDESFTRSLEAYRDARAARGAPLYQGVRVDWLCVGHYFDMEERVVHAWGLSQPVLARMKMDDYLYKAHSPGLLEHAQEIRRMEIATGIEGRPGMYARALELGVAPEWVAKNAETLERIEAKMYNRHDFAENLRLALWLDQAIDPDP